jgi:hypothetical protein
LRRGQHALAIGFVEFKQRANAVVADGDRHDFFAHTNHGQTSFRTKWNALDDLNSDA